MRFAPRSAASWMAAHRVRRQYLRRTLEADRRLDAERGATWLGRSRRRSALLLTVFLAPAQRRRCGSSSATKGWFQTASSARGLGLLWALSGAIREERSS